KMSYNTRGVVRFVKRQVPGMPTPTRGQDDLAFLKRGFFGQFARNPLGTLIGLIMFFLTLDYMASPTLGPFAGYTDFTNDMALIYNNSNWILTFAFAMLPVALAFAFVSGKSIGLRKEPTEDGASKEEEPEPDNVGDSI